MNNIAGERVQFGQLSVELIFGGDVNYSLNIILLVLGRVIANDPQQTLVWFIDCSR